MMILKTTYLVAFTALTTFRGSSFPTAIAKSDYANFLFKNDPGKDCNWVGRNAGKRCSRKWKGKTINTYCPQVCGACPGESDDNSGSCADDSKFKFNNAKRKDCTWVGLNPKNRCSRSWKGLELSAYCPEMCGTCPEVEPTECEDDETLQYRKNPKRDCGWVANNVEERCQKMWQGKKLEELCPITCDSCPLSTPDTGGNSGGEGCCSLDYKECIGWCGPTKESCESCNHHDGVGWLENGPPKNTCKKRWRGCENSPDTCCPGLTCREDANNYLMCLPTLTASTDKPTASPTASPTGSPSASPTPSPTNSPTNSPTDFPTFIPTEMDSFDSSSSTFVPTLVDTIDSSEIPSGVATGPCCSLDYKTCVNWCGADYNSCAGCNHHDGVFWLENGPPQNDQCLSRWTGCESDADACCDGLTCREDYNNFLMCLPFDPPFTSAPTDQPPTQSPTTPTDFQITAMPTSRPSNDQATPSPTIAPTNSPQALVTEPFTDLPTVSPTVLPTSSPSDSQTTSSPTVAPTNSPQALVTEPPTDLPTVSPTVSPTSSPSDSQTTSSPTVAPTNSPQALVTKPPTASPTVSPTVSPTSSPSDSQTTSSPTVAPTNSPQALVTKPPTASPTVSATGSPHITSAPQQNSNGCCSLDYKNCVDWCGSDFNSCTSCANTEVVWLPNGEPNSQCGERWTGCNENNDTGHSGCCSGLSCQYRSGYNYMACMPNLDPTSAPVPPPPTDAPTKSPTSPREPTVSPAPTSEPSLLSTDKAMNAWDVYLGLDYITHKNSFDPPNYALVASGGAAGSGNLVVSESQAYGLLITGTVLASWNTHAGKVPNSKRSDVMKSFEGYFNFWVDMNKNSSNKGSNCQASGNYCKSASGSNYVCLPDWRHYKTGGSEATGPAPDADEDAIVGIILAVKAVENDVNKPIWYETARKWADASATAFFEFEVDKSKNNHRLVKLGSCWGGWEGQGNNPSYHSPGSFRVMRDYQRSFPNAERSGYSAIPEDEWNKLINTSHEVLRAVQCSNDGALVPNWATIGIDSNDNIIHTGGGFSGSGTPQYEYGAEAARTTFRVALDAALYPEMSSDWSPYLSQFNWRLDGNFQNGSFSSSTFPGCRGQNTNQNINMFGGWQSNAFIFGPTYSSLIAASSDIGNAEAMIDTAGQILGGNPLPGSYYPRSWAMISNLMLNGAMESAGNILKK